MEVGSQGRFGYLQVVKVALRLSLVGIGARGPIILWGPASRVGIPFEMADFLGGFGAQLAGSESRSKSLILGGFGAKLAGSESHSKSLILGGVLGPS